MSKKKKTFETPVEAVEVTAVDGAAVGAEVAVEAPKEKKKGIKKGASRFFALITLVACALVAILLPLASFKADWSADSQTLVNTAKALFDKDNANDKLFGFLPALYAGKETAVTIANLLPYVVALFLVVAVLFALFGGLFGGKRCSVKTALVFVMLAGIAQFAGTYYVSNEMAKAEIDVAAIVVAAAALVLLIVVCLATRAKKDKAAKKEDVVEAPVVEEAVDPVAEMMKTFKTEEVIEAYVYEGGPVAGIEIAEEVYPTLASLDAQKDPDGAARNTVASLLGNGFDAFLITLNEKEKSEFIDLYVLKCKGVMPEIPGYVVGGDNKEFFNKVFIYLGQYRDKIPADLLAKMYAFAMKI